MYSPEIIKEEHPTYNTMSCEQTFVWLSRFKKVVCTMQKTHPHFYIHRMVKRRNSYIEYCYMAVTSKAEKWSTMNAYYYIVHVYLLYYIKQFTLNSLH